MPVTILTGFLGSGKTTLLNHLLRAEHGKRIVVIENEFGEVDIDGELVAFRETGDKDIMLLNNGCLCCTVRSDLVEMLTRLVKERRGMFDHILIETTGLANPAPIIQTFYLEPALLDSLRLDGVVKPANLLVTKGCEISERTCVSCMMCSTCPIETMSALHICLSA